MAVVCGYGLEMQHFSNRQSGNEQDEERGGVAVVAGGKEFLPFASCRGRAVLSQIESPARQPNN